MSYTITATGKLVNLYDLKIGDIDVVDMTLQLSKLCRFKELAVVSILWLSIVTSSLPWFPQI